MSKQSLSMVCRLIAGATLTAVFALAGDFVVIANASIKSADVSADDLRDVFLGEKSSLRDGSHATPVTLKEGAAHNAFLQAVAGKTDAAFRAVWRKQVFTGKGTMPRTFDTEAALAAFVGSTPGAIGYVSEGIAAPAGAKILKVK
jgi:ABC-type phosphate transport system substrate-binding protein